MNIKQASAVVRASMGIFGVDRTADALGVSKITCYRLSHGDVKKVGTLRKIEAHRNVVLEQFGVTLNETK